MKKLLMMLLVVGMLISVGGCTAVAIGALAYGPGLVFGIAILAPDLDEPIEYDGGIAHYV